MVGSKPSGYMTEEARLEAQRRMLIDRYGLGLSDDSDDGGDANDAEAESDNSSRANGNANGSGAAAQLSVTNGRAVQPDRPVTDDAPSEAATCGEGSSINDGELASILSQDDTYPEAAEQSGAPDRAPGWPGVELIDRDEKKIHAVYEYDSSMQSDAVLARDLRVTKITNYNSQLLENHGRKIAVNDQIITYAVGGHIRAILRNSSVKALLKGHGSTVVDMEFLSLQEQKIELLPGENLSVLGSVAEDGSVYVWKIVRSDKTDVDTLEVADTICFEHPNASNGKSYSRISFRPGNSIVAANGIGVAMLLVDADAQDVRVVELVKMNDKMMVRDKFLKAANELDGAGSDVDAKVDTATWLSERIIATSRRGQVCLWNAEGTQVACIAKLPRKQATPVTSMHAITEESLLLVAEGGKQYEVWSVAKVPGQSTARAVSLRQTIRLFDEDTENVHCVTAVDPAAELVVVSNVKYSSFFVLHYNSAAQAFDALTEVPVKQSILSICVTRNTRKAPEVAAGPILNSGVIEELGLWCVQPRGIQMIHLPSKECGPKTAIEPVVLPIESPQTLTINVKGTPLAGTSMSGSEAPHTPLARDAPRASGGPREAVPPAAVGAAALPPLHPTSKRNPSSKPGGVPKSQGSPSVRESAAVESRSVVESASLPEQKGGDSSQKQVSVDADTIADSFLEAAKRSIEQFEASANARTASEKEELNQMLQTVTKQAESNLERFVNACMKKTLADALIPGVSKIMADSQATMRQQQRESDATITKDLFEQALTSASINESFTNGCVEMTRQVSDVVMRSMASKYETLIPPTVSGVNEAAEDLSTSVSLLRSELEKLSARADAAENKDAPRIVAIEPADVKVTIEEKLAKGLVDDAFLTALDKEDVSLVTWLCSKFDASTFFDEYTMSQTSLLSLVQQLAMGLSEGEEVTLKVKWLQELMLVLEPESEEIEMYAATTLKDVSNIVGALRKNSAIVEQHSGLEKALRTLNRLVESHVD